MKQLIRYLKNKIFGEYIHFKCDLSIQTLDTNIVVTREYRYKYNLKTKRLYKFSQKNGINKYLPSSDHIKIKKVSDKLETELLNTRRNNNLNKILNG